MGDSLSHLDDLLPKVMTEGNVGAGGCGEILDTLRSTFTTDRKPRFQVCRLRYASFVY